MIITVKPKKISLFLANCQYTAAQVQQRTGADIVFNGTLYTFATMTPCMDFKADGVVYSDEEPLYEGYGWNKASTIMTRTYDMAKYDNFISSCDIIKQGKKCSVNGIAWVRGARQRTAIGWKADGSMVIYVNPYATTIDTVMNEMLTAGCVDAINLDGGGSTQISTKKYGSVYSPEGRRVQNYICVWEQTTTSSTPVSNPQTPSTSTPSAPTTSTPANNTSPVSSGNKTYWAQTPIAITHFPIDIRGDRNLNVRALPTNASKLVRTIPKGQVFATTGYASYWNKTWMRITDGYVYRAYTECGNPYAEPTTNLRKWNSGEGVRWMQWWLGQRGYRGLDKKVLGCDGQFGPNTEYALITFQREHGITPDGICGADTRRMLKA